MQDEGSLASENWGARFVVRHPRRRDGRADKRREPALLAC